MAEKKILVTTADVKKTGSAKWIIAVASAIAVAVILIFAALTAVIAKGQGNVALIRVSGTISSSGSGETFFEKAASADEILGMIEQAEKTDAVKGILIEINSPGGSPVASEELMKAVKNATKPTVAVIRDIGTSGAYWVASAADYAVASPVSITGSVGVSASYLEFSQLLKDYGVRYERLVSAERKDIGSPFRNLSEEERAIAKEALAKMHSYFLSSVKGNRGLNDADNAAAIEKISTAIVFLGSEAKELGLVDELGGKGEAEEWLKQQTGLAEIKYVTYERRPLFDIGSLLAGQASAAGNAFVSSALTTFLKAGRLENFVT